jgi:hypothetical protein
MTRVLTVRLDVIGKSLQEFNDHPAGDLQAKVAIRDRKRDCAPTDRDAGLSMVGPRNEALPWIENTVARFTGPRSPMGMTMHDPRLDGPLGCDR